MIKIRLPHWIKKHFCEEAPEPDIFINGCMNCKKPFTPPFKAYKGEWILCKECATSLIQSNTSTKNNKHGTL